MKQIFFILTFFITSLAFAQVKIGDNATIIDSNAILEMESSSKGMLLPRITAIQRDAIASPTNSMLVYNTTEGCINIYNAAQSKWKSICGDDAEGSAAYSLNCNSLVVSGTYQTGVALQDESNFITVSVNVTELGSYSIVTDSGGMYFSAAGNFTVLGTQDVVLNGQGYPMVAGLNFLALNISGSLCTTVINVTNGLATVTGCGTLGSLTGNVFANQAIETGTVYQSYTVGPAYTGGGAYGITSATSNGIRLSSPVNGTFNASGTPIDYTLSGTALQAGNTILNYSVNGFACSFTVPVQSGTGRASAVACTGALSGTYTVGSAMTGSNTKVVTLTVSTVGTFYIRTDTVNGIYFAGSATAASLGSLNVTLTAVGTPLSGISVTHTVTVSSSAVSFTSCTFDVTSSLPITIPEFNTLSCSPLSAAVTYIKANNPSGSDFFGGDFNISGPIIFAGQQTKLSADGLTLAVGAAAEDGDLTGGAINSTNNNTWSSSGAAYIYTRASLSSNWAFQAKLKPTQLKTLDRFGNSVDLSNDGNTLIVGSFREEGSGTGVNPVDNNTVDNAGAAYVFIRTGSTWSQQAYLKANNPDTSDYFGVSVAISGDGNTVAVGANGEDSDAGGINPTQNNGTKTNSGAVYTYTRSGSTWSVDAFLKASNTDKDDFFGVSVALNNDGTTLVVGAMNEDCSNIGINPTANNSTSNAGAAYVFQKSGTWSQQAYLKASQVSIDDLFGFSVDIDGSGNKIIVGAYQEDGNGTGVNPVANESASTSGAAYLFNRTGSTWTHQAYLKPSNTGANDQFGRSVAISNDGNHIVCGAPNEDGSNTCVNSTQNNSGADRGAVYMFSLLSGNWISTFQFKPSIASDSDVFSTSSISSDGKSVAIGTGFENGSGSGINPTVNESAVDSGAVVVFTKP